jgi:hypothetical protein
MRDQKTKTSQQIGAAWRNVKNLSLAFYFGQRFKQLIRFLSSM